MARQLVSKSLAYGNPFTNAQGGTFSVYIAGTSSLQPIYDSKVGGSLLDNPMTVGADSIAEFWVDPGVYKLVFTPPVGSSKTIEEHIVIDDRLTKSPTGELLFLDVANLAAGTSLNFDQLTASNIYSFVGKTVKTIYNNTTSKAGGAEYVIVSSDPGNLSTLIGGIWVGANHDLGGGYYAKLDTGATISAETFGLIKNTLSVNSSPALNAFFTFCKTQQYTYSPAADVGYVFVRATLVANIPTGVYAVAETVNATNEDGNINFNDSVFVPHENYNPVDWAFDFVAWTTEISRLRFAKFTNTSNVARIRNNNADSGIITLKRCNFGGSGIYEIDCRSSIVEFKNCRIDRITKMIVTTCDKLRFNTCWINPPAFTADESCLFEVLNHSPIVEFDGGVIVPRPQTFDRCAIVNMSNSSNVNAKGAIIKFINVLAGNEPNTTSYVNVYSASNTSTSRGSRVYFLGGSYGSSSGGTIPAVRLFALPNSVTFSDIDGYEEDTHTESLVYFDETHQTYNDASAYLVANSRPPFRLYLNGNVQQNFAGFPRNSKMLLALKSQPPVTYGTVTVNGGIAQVLPYPTSSSLNRYIAMRVTIINKNNGGADLISEYVVAGNFSGSITVAPVFEGTSVAAPRMTTTGTTVSIDTNGSTLSQTYFYQIQQIGDYQNPFY